MSLLFKMLLLSILFTQTAAAKTIEVTDDLGRLIVLANPASRIITTSPHTAELIGTIGAINSLIAVSSGSDFPPEVSKLPVIGSFSGLDREKILSLRPDLAVVWSSGNKISDLNWLKKQDIPIFYSEPQKLADIASSLISLGKLTGHEKNAIKAAHAFLNDLERFQCTREQPYSVYYSIWENPAMTIGGKHWLNEVLTLSGLKNIFSSQDRNIFAVEKEALWAQKYDFSINIKDQNTIIKPLISNINISNTAGRPSPRLSLVIKAICKQIGKPL